MKQRYSCFNCDHVDGVFYKEHEGETTWWLGLASDGQAHYACDDCKGSLWNVHEVKEDQSE